MTYWYILEANEKFPLKAELRMMDLLLCRVPARENSNPHYLINKICFVLRIPVNKHLNEN